MNATCASVVSRLHRRPGAINVISSCGIDIADNVDSLGYAPSFRSRYDVTSAIGEIDKRGEEWEESASEGRGEESLSFTPLVSYFRINDFRNHALGARARPVSW